MEIYVFMIWLYFHTYKHQNYNQPLSVITLYHICFQIKSYIAKTQVCIASEFVYYVHYFSIADLIWIQSNVILENKTIMCSSSICRGEVWSRKEAAGVTTGV